MLIMDAPMVKWLSMVADAEKSIIKWNLSGTFGHLLEHKIVKMASYENAAAALKHNFHFKISTEGSIAWKNV